MRLFSPILCCLVLTLTTACSSDTPDDRAIIQPPIDLDSMRTPSYTPVPSGEPLPEVKMPVEPIEPLVTPVSPSLPKEVRRRRIALLLPLSGASAKIGQEIYNAAELAMFDIIPTDVMLLPYDTKGTPEGAVDAVKEALINQVDLIIGPVFSKTTSAIAPIASKHEVPVISFSNDVSLLQQDIFLFGFMPSAQINRVTEYAYRRGIDDFAALVPDNSYGIMTSNELIHTLDEHDIQAHRIEWYRNLDAKLSGSIRKIAEDFQRRTSADNHKVFALLIPEGGHNLLTITKRVFHKRLDNFDIRLLGSGEWDDPVIAGEPLLIGSWFASSPPEYREYFEKHYYETYGHHPIRIASLAYDAVGYAVALEGNYSYESLTNPRGFSGVNGVFRFTKAGMAQRGLAVLEITEDGVRIIDPAPASFGN